MTTKKHILVFMTAVITMVTGMLSCEYKDLDEYDYSSPSFILNLNCDRVDSIPDKYLVVFYPMDGQGYYAREISGQSAVINNIPAGQYKVTAWNKYLEHTRVDIDADRNKTVAYAYPYFTTTELPIKVLDSLYNGQTIYDVPDYMVHANTEFFELYKATENQELTIQADSMVITVELRLHGIASLSLAKQVKATVNNVAKYRFPAFEFYSSTILQFN